MDTKQEARLIWAQASYDTAQVIVKLGGKIAQCEKITTRADRIIGKHRAERGGAKTTVTEEQYRQAMDDASLYDDLLGMLYSDLAVASEKYYLERRMADHIEEEGVLPVTRGQIETRLAALGHEWQKITDPE